ncbi:MAG: cytochrome c [Granulosicoccus sp.]
MTTSISFWLAATKTTMASAVLLVGSALSQSAIAAGDAAAGEEKAATCAACHGADGVSQVATNPILAGQYPSYIEHALKSYRSGERQNAIMAGFASQLTDQDIADLAAWFASQKGPLKTAPGL